MATKKKNLQTPLILRFHRLMEAFAKSDDERDFYLNREEGFLLYADLNKPQEDLDTLEKELEKNADLYSPIPKLTFYEVKKLMESFINEKVYDIDTKEKLLDIIQSRDARERFLEFIYDHLIELEKWQQYYQERFRIRIIEWLRENSLHFVFEEDLELPAHTIESLKHNGFETKASKEILSARKILEAKAKTYYSNEALNPRPKRGRPPKQAIKVEALTQTSNDIYLSVPSSIRTFLFAPDITNASSVTFSSKFETGEELIASLRNNHRQQMDATIESLNQKLADIRQMSSNWMPQEDMEPPLIREDELEEDVIAPSPPKKPVKQAAKKPAATKKAPAVKKPVAAKKPAPAKKPAVKKAPVKMAPAKKVPAKRVATKKTPEKKEVAKKRPAARKKVAAKKKK